MTATPARVSPVREHLLAVASGLFYREGIANVGVDRILAEAQTTRATLYRHFRGKEDLVVAYLTAEDEGLRSAFAGAESAAASPDELLELAIGGIADDATRHHTRGCPFINATAEYADAQSPVRQVVARHREWFRSTLARYVEAAGRPEATADQLVMLRDAVLVGCYLDDATAVRATFVATARSIAGLAPVPVGADV
jgi:AcrR family transcriptional regulator